MKILAVEFSSLRRSVAVVEGANGAAAAVLGVAADTRGQATRAIALVETALNLADLERDAIECLAVGLGPGSYAGIRAAIALAQGWQLARGVKLLGVSSVECLALQARLEAMSGQVTCVIDAQRNEFYLATYEISPQATTLLAPLRLTGWEEVRARHAAGARLIGPEVSRWFPDLRDMFPEAAGLGRLAASRADFVMGEALEPVYLRETSFVKAPPPRSLPE